MWSRRSVDLHTRRRMSPERHVSRYMLVSTYRKGLLVQICNISDDIKDEKYVLLQ